MSVNVCLDDVFWITEDFVTKFGVVMQHHKPWVPCRKLFVCVVFAIFKGKVTARARMIKIWLFLLYLLNCWFLCNQAWSDDTSSEARVSCEKNLITAFRVKVTSRAKMLMFVWMISSKPTKHFVSNFGIVMHHYESECHAKRFICYFQGQGHCKSWYDQIVTFSAVSLELLILCCQFTKLGLIVHYHTHKPECFMEKLDCCVQGQGHSKISKCQWMFVQIIFSKSLNILLPNLVWWCISMTQIVFQKDWFAVFKVKVTVKNNI